MKLKDKVAIVTGAGRGIGRAIALAYAREGAHLVVAARTEPQVQETAAQVRDLGRQALAVQCDISRRSEVAAMVDRTLGEFGRVDVLVNSAGGITPIGPLVQVDPDEWLRTVAVNLGGTFLCCHAVVPTMIQQGGGKIINMSGGGATSANPNFSAYAASKTAVVRLTETLAVELRGYNIQVNAIAPGAVYTSLTEDILRSGAAAGEMLQAEALQVRQTGALPTEAAELAVFLASGDSKGLTGRLIAARWDDWRHMTPERFLEIERSDWYVLRRTVPPSQSREQ